MELTDLLNSFTYYKKHILLFWIIYFNMVAMFCWRPSSGDGKKYWKMMTDARAKVFSTKMIIFEKY